MKLVKDRQDKDGSLSGTSLSLAENVLSVDAKEEKEKS